MELEFFGAAGEVTGSCHIIRAGGHQILLDCGMIQGGKKEEARNHSRFPFKASEIDAVVLSHAHIDHSGRLPLLVRRGFKGSIHTQSASKDLCEILLQDSADITERDTERENRKRQRKALDPVSPLYTRKDARRAIRSLVGHRYDEKVKIGPEIEICFRDAGHIMGSSIVEVFLHEEGVRRKLVFSGDLGQHDAPILRDPTPVEDADLVLMESTYGNRTHRDRRRTVEEIGEIIRDAAAHEGNILIPAFSVGRSQDVLYMLGKNYRQWGLERWRVFLDSPLGIEASKIYWDYPHLYDGEATKLRQRIDEMPVLENLHFTTTPEESRVINKMKSGAIIIAGSGMCNGGRILQHLKHNVWRPECHVIIVGYQARGSIGRQLVEKRQRIRIYGETVRVQSRIHTVGGLSAHGDQEDLTRWYRGFKTTPPVYLVHGETRSSQGLQKKLSADCGATVRLAEPGRKIDLARL